MSVDDGEVARARKKPVYWAGIWAFRIMLAVLGLQFALSFVGVATFVGPVRAGFLLAVLTAGIAGYVLLDRAGVRVFGFSYGIWSRRKMVYKDVFGVGGRGAVDADR